jgi:hypothetical protein
MSPTGPRKRKMVPQTCCTETDEAAPPPKRALTVDTGMAEEVDYLNLCAHAFRIIGETARVLEEAETTVMSYSDTHDVREGLETQQRRMHQLLSMLEKDEDSIPVAHLLRDVYCKRFEVLHEILAQRERGFCWNYAPACALAAGGLAFMVYYHCRVLLTAI